MEFIPYGRQDITDDDIQKVVAVLKSDFITQGPAVTEFENKISKYTGALETIAMNSATSALHVACRALGVEAGDQVWTSPITFLASANCALYCNAKIDFVDIDAKTFNMCPEKLEQKLEKAQKENKLPKVIIPVHLAGQSCDMEAIYKLSQKYDFKIIEDASHAIGGKYQGKPIGDCRYSDVTVFSFHPVKIVTTAEGGVCTTQNKELAQKIRLLQSHYMTRDESLMHEKSHGPWYYEQIGLGYNYRLTDLQAALGSSQFERVDQYVTKRNELAKRYDFMLDELPVTTPYQSTESYSAFHLYIIQLNLNEISYSHLDVFEKLRAANIGVNLHYIPVHLQPYYRNMGFQKGDFPVAESYYQRAISLPLFPMLKSEEQDYVCQTLAKILKS